MTSLYICYQSLLDPLTRTQVVAYLEGLAKAGYTVVLLTFEKRRISREETEVHKRQLRELGITWYWLTYHKRPTLPATAWDVLMGVLVGLRLIGKHNVKLIHARSHVPAVMGRLLKHLSGAKLLFDIRGLMAEEYVDAGVWPADGFLFRLVKRAERRLVGSADAIVVLTEKAHGLLKTWYGERIKDMPVVVIPCCVDLRRQQETPSRELVAAGAAEAGASTRGLGGDGDMPAFETDEDASRPLTFAYVGKLDGWYLTEEMADFMAASLEVIPALRWQVWTQSPSVRLRELLVQRGIADRVEIGQVPAEELPERLRHCDAGLSFIKPCLSKLASSPTKVGEYLAAGLPVIANPGIGDMDLLLGGGASGDAVGVMVGSFDKHGLRAAVERLQELLQDAELPRRCREAALRELDLESVGWSRYRELYGRLLRDDPESGTGTPHRVEASARTREAREARMPLAVAGQLASERQDG